MLTSEKSEVLDALREGEQLDRRLSGDQMVFKNLISFGVFFQYKFDNLVIVREMTNSDIKLTPRDLLRVVLHPRGQLGQSLLVLCR